MDAMDASNNMLAEAHRRLAEKTRGLKDHPLNILERLAHEKDPDLLYIEKCAKEAAERFRPLLVAGPNGAPTIKSSTAQLQGIRIERPNPSTRIPFFMNSSYDPGDFRSSRAGVDYKSI